MPNRIIKESIRTSKSVNALSDFQFRVWTYLITYVDDYGRGSADPELLKGLVFTRRKGVTEQQISKALADLANSGMITLYEVDGESFLYFPNWNKHQRIRDCKPKFPAPPECPQNSQPAGTFSGSPQSAATCGELPPESESNPNPNPESKNPPIPPQGGNAQSFEEFWSAYPKKVGKGYALKSWNKISPGKELTQKILSAVESQKHSQQWKKDDGQFIPNPATWLNQGRWEDNLEVELPRTSSYDINDVEELSHFNLPFEL